MPRIKAPPHNEALQLLKIAIFKCDATHKAICGILWQESVPNGHRLIFEMAHGSVGDELDPEKIVDMCRGQCIGTHCHDTTAKGSSMFNNFLDRYLHGAGRLLYKRGIKV